MFQICAATTLTASFVALGTIDIQGYWAEGPRTGNLAVYVKYVADNDQSGGYPVVRLRWWRYNSAGDLVECYDPILDSTLSIEAGVATVTCATPEYPLTPMLTDSDGSLEYPLMVVAPAYAAKVTLEAKQAGDTAVGHFGTLAADLSRLL